MTKRMEESELCCTTPRDSILAKANFCPDDEVKLSLGDRGKHTLKQGRRVQRQGEAHTTAGEVCAKTGSITH